MQPKQREYNHAQLDEPKPYSYYSKFETRDPLKTNDIDGAYPAHIPGYTGTKADKILAHARSGIVYGPSKFDQSQQWQSVSKKFGKSTLFNPSAYKDDFNHFIPVKPVGMLPTSTNARILPSQANYSAWSQR
jgi:hypothetical protein